jgi:hypothetical protein
MSRIYIGVPGLLIVLPRDLASPNRLQTQDGGAANRATWDLLQFS